MTAWSQTWQLHVTDGHGGDSKVNLNWTIQVFPGQAALLRGRCYTLLTLNSIVLQAVTLSLSWQNTSSVYQLGGGFQRQLIPQITIK